MHHSVVAFKAKNGFTPRRELARQYVTVANRLLLADNHVGFILAMCHAMRLGWDVNTGYAR